MSTTAKQPESKTSITLRAVDWTFGAPTEQRTKKETCDKIFEIKRKGRKKGIEMYKKRKRRKEKETL